jgi:hypothetical protein
MLKSTSCEDPKMRVLCVKFLPVTKKKKKILNKAVKRNKINLMKFGPHG